MYKIIKRCLDLFFSLILVPFVFVIITLFGTLIKIEDNGPVFYMGERLGKNGKRFKMYKFRSMRVNAPDLRNTDGSTYNSSIDPRLTKIGRIIRKFSIDEIPQILNVLKGDMSFIGPRPDLPEAINIYTLEEKNKLEVRPGITGYNQAYFRNSVSQTERFENDLKYVYNLSFRLDLTILIKTFTSVILTKNINMDDNKRTDLRGEKYVNRG